MKRVRLKGFEKSQNTEEYNRLLKVTGGTESPYSLGEETAISNELDEKVADDLGRYRGYTIGPEEARRLRLQQIGERIARDRSCI